MKSNKKRRRNMSVCIGCFYERLCFSEYLKEDIPEDDCMIGTDNDFQNNDFV